jgi:hypothetical protein
MVSMMNNYIAENLKGAKFEVTAPNADAARKAVRDYARKNEMMMISCKRVFKNGKLGKEIMKTSDRIWQWYKYM